jgi:lipid-binding SYLF domain-containing protein
MALNYGSSPQQESLMHRSIYRILIGTAVLGVLIAPTTGIAQSAGMAQPAPATTAQQKDPALDAAVDKTVRQCQQLSPSCATTTKAAAGVLVFPEMVKADLIIGGAGGRGALVEKGKITGYYNIGAASAGLQAGVETSSQLIVFRSPEALAELKSGSTWKAAARGGVTLVSADANATEVTGDVVSYIFDAKGLHAGVSVDAFNVWRAGEKRP